MIKIVNPNQPISVGVYLPRVTREALVSILKKYKHVFAWMPTNLVGGDRKLI